MRVSLLGYLVGAICLAVGLVLLAIAVPTAAGVAIYPERIPVSFLVRGIIGGLLFLFVAARFWWGAIKRTSGDHILSDQRGLLVGLMVATTAVFIGLISWTMLNPGFWAGAISGVLDAARDFG